jgi:hypothetical protein
MQAHLHDKRFFLQRLAKTECSLYLWTVPIGIANTPSLKFIIPRKTAGSSFYRRLKFPSFESPFDLQCPGIIHLLKITR